MPMFQQRFLDITSGYQVLYIWKSRIKSTRIKEVNFGKAEHRRSFVFVSKEDGLGMHWLKVRPFFLWLLSDRDVVIIGKVNKINNKDFDLLNFSGSNSNHENLYAKTGDETASNAISNVVSKSASSSDENEACLWRSESRGSEGGGWIWWLVCRRIALIRRRIARAEGRGW